MQFYKELARDSIINRMNLDELYSELVENGLQDIADDMKALRLGLQISGERLFRLAFYLKNSECVRRGN